MTIQDAASLIIARRPSSGALLCILFMLLASPRAGMAADFWTATGGPYGGTVISVLAALILPGIQNARESARRAQCLSQMRNVGLAFNTYQTDHDGQLPYLRGGFDINFSTKASSRFTGMGAPP